MAQVDPAEENESLLPEYPDPEAAACTTTYPWLEVGAQGAVYHTDSSDALHDGTESGDSSSLVSGNDESSDDEAREFRADEGARDSDYNTPSSAKSEDDNMSDENSLNPNSNLPGQHANTESRWRTENNDVKKSERLSALRNSGSGKGMKGAKRGFRRPVEPGLDFTALLSEATLSFTNGDLEDAEVHILRALKLNPEVYQAHSLLSEVHAARGDVTKAIHAAWNGAHTRPRDSKVWKRVASLLLELRSGDRDDHLRDAVYCYSRIIAVDRYDVEARYQRAAINRELGYKKKVVAEYESLRKHLPDDTTVLRHLADIYIELNAAEKALKHYEAFITAAHNGSSDTVIPFTWSDVNIVAELCLMTENFVHGIKQVKRLSRWLLGRRHETFWDGVNLDDREWDIEDRPRRIQASGFHTHRYPPNAYGQGLPLEIRTKLGIFRLCIDGKGFSEAKIHFDELRSDDYQVSTRVLDYLDLFREAANALRLNGHFTDALQFLNSIRHAKEDLDAPLLMEIASCYRAMGSHLEARKCYETILEAEPSFIEAHVALCNMERGWTEAKSYKMPVQVPVLTAQRKASRNSKFQELHPDALIEREAEILTLYSQWKRLAAYEIRTPDETEAWSQASQLLLQTFQETKAFYPSDRSQRFWGFSPEARNLSSRRHIVPGGVCPHPGTSLVTMEGDEVTIPDEYLGLRFPDWLDIFLEHALEMARQGHAHSAYSSIQSAIGANVFYHAPEALLAIHVCWLACALLLNDGSTLCNILRWFIVQYQFVTDSYQLFSGISRICSSQKEWYNFSPTQKFILRQIKILDQLHMHTRLSSLAQDPEVSPHSDWNPSGQPNNADLNIALLMLYGHILLAGQTYSSATHYFLRALSLDAGNSAIKFSLAMAHIHWALKRQAENRHRIFSQGLSFLMEYYYSSEQSQDRVRLQTADYNLASTFQLVGLVDLAIPFFERCLDSQSRLRKLELMNPENESARAAALALQSHWATTGDLHQAQCITEAWLQI